jgi:hypothetical protein
MVLVVLCAGCGSGPAPRAGSVLPRVVGTAWSAEAGGLCVTVEGPIESGSDLPGEGLQLRLSGPNLPRPVFAQPTREGETCLALGRTPASFRELRPGPVSVDALLGGRLVEVARTQLDQATIDRMAAVAVERGRVQTGPGGPGGALGLELTTEPAVVDAGGTFVLRGRVVNEGTRPAYRVRALLTGDGVDAVALEFGWLEPGESLEQTRLVSVPRSLRANELTLRVETGEQHSASFRAPGSMSVSVAPLPPPALEVNTVVTPDRHGRLVREGGEGKLRPGDDLHLVCEVTNFGDSDLRGGVARLRMPEGDVASVRVGRAIVGDLPPGATTRAHFWFVVKAALGSGTVPLVVEIADTDLGVVHEQAVVLTIEDE